MNGLDYDRVIAQEKKVLVSIKEHGEKIIPEFKQVAASYLREWSILLLKDYMTAKTEITQSLGSQRLEELKGEFKDFLEGLPERTAKRLDDPQIWLHRFAIPDYELSDLSYSYYLEKKSQKFIRQAIKELIGPVGALLIKYGYAEIETDYNWEMTSGEILHYAEDLPARGIEGYQAYEKLLERYKNILIEYVYASQNLWKAEQAKKSG